MPTHRPTTAAFGSNDTFELGHSASLFFDGSSADAVAEPLAGMIFEMADVLYDTTVWRRWLWRLLPRLGIRADYHAFFAVWDREFLVEVQQGRRELVEAFHAFLAGHGLSWGQIDEIEAACRQRRETITRGTWPLPGVVATLAKLADEGLKLAVLADAVHTAKILEDHLVALGLGGRFAVVVSSVDLESTTPSPLGFETVLAGLELRPSQAAYVGRRARSLSGASAFGLRTIAFNQDEPAHCDIAITQFFELQDIARCWRAGAGAAGARQTFLDAA